jgi:hypothetical protein
MTETGAPAKTDNPYVGPRAFRPGEQLYARDRETQELADQLIAQRIVLLHSPSGAGKTSLIQTGLSEVLRKEGFAPTPALRVNTLAPGDGKVHNRYVYSAAFYLLGGELRPSKLAEFGFREIVKTAADRAAGHVPVLVIDQFEEILLMDPTDRDAQHAFFRDLGQALADTETWAILSMREDYMGGLDRFLRYIPGHLSSRFRLDFLDHDGAREAIQRPAKSLGGVDFADNAADELVKQLAVVKIQRPKGKEEEVEAPYVQPVQLQVVCNSLWRTLRKNAEDHGKEFKSIKLKDIKRHADIDRALQGYYAGVVAHVAGKTSADEQIIRRWVQGELITPQRFRSQTLTGPVSGDVAPLTILHELERAYLIRSDTRADSTWYELSHDKLVEPILADNENWERPRLRPWQIAARQWEDNHDPSRLLEGWDLHVAEREAESIDLTHTEESFLEASVQAAHARNVLARTRNLLGMAWGLVIAQSLVIILLIVLLFVT